MNYRRILTRLLRVTRYAINNDLRGRGKKDGRQESRDFWFIEGIPIRLRANIKCGLRRILRCSCTQYRSFFDIFCHLDVATKPLLLVPRFQIPFPTSQCAILFFVSRLPTFSSCILPAFYSFTNTDLALTYFIRIFNLEEIIFRIIFRLSEIEFFRLLFQFFLKIFYFEIVSISNNI